jgi:hypothetical protein
MTGEGDFVGGDCSGWAVIEAGIRMTPDDL